FNTYRSTLVHSLFFFNNPATTEIYTLSLHDALPIYFQPGALPGRRKTQRHCRRAQPRGRRQVRLFCHAQRHGEEVRAQGILTVRSEEHTSELQSRGHLVCRLLLEKKNKNTNHIKIVT